MAISIYHICGERKNTLGHRYSRVSLYSLSMLFKCNMCYRDVFTIKALGGKKSGPITIQTNISMNDVTVLGGGGVKDFLTSSRGVKKYQMLSDVIYGRPLRKTNSFRFVVDALYPEACRQF
jgi:hypothetical protein